MGVLGRRDGLAARPDRPDARVGRGKDLLERHGRLTLRPMSRLHGLRHGLPLRSPVRRPDRRDARAGGESGRQIRVREAPPRGDLRSVSLPRTSTCARCRVAHLFADGSSAALPRERASEALAAASGADGCSHAVGFRGGFEVAAARARRGPRRAPGARGTSVRLRPGRFFPRRQRGDDPRPLGRRVRRSDSQGTGLLRRALDSCGAGRRGARVRAGNDRALRSRARWTRFWSTPRAAARA